MLNLKLYHFRAASQSQRPFGGHTTELEANAISVTSAASRSAMKARAWIKAVGFMSPRAASRQASSPAAVDPPTPSSAPISLALLATLTRVVHFLDENHLEEEELYRVAGLRLERTDLLEFCRRNKLPDLATYSPHSIASVVKEILSETYEPLIPATIAQQMMEAVAGGHVDDQAANAITETFKGIRSTTREFLQVFLSHLNRVSTSGPSRMSVTNLALHVGIALIRPTDDRGILNSKAMMRRRKCVAEFLINQASVLPYDCATEMQLPALPEITASPVSSEQKSSSPKQLHFVQVTWDAGEQRFTDQQLEEMFAKFGEIANLGVNDQGNRAIVAYTNAESAEDAERSSTPLVRVRRRKPRQNSGQHDDSMLRLHQHSETAAAKRSVKDASSGDASLADSAMESNTQRNRDDQKQVEITSPDEAMVIEDIESDPIQVEGSPRSNEEIEVTTKTLVGGDDEIVDAAVRADQATEEYAKEALRAPTLMVETTSAEDFAPPTSSSRAEKSRVTACDRSSDLSPTKEVVLDSVSVNSGQEKMIKPETPPPTLVCIAAEPETLDFPTIPPVIPHTSTPSNAELESVTALTLPDQTEMSAESVAVVPSRSSPKRLLSKATSDEEQGLVPHEIESHKPLSISRDNETQTLFPPSLDKATETLGTAAPAVLVDAAVSTSPTSEAAEHLTALQEKLRKLHTMLSTSTAALSTAKKSTEFERALFQLHTQILHMATDSLVDPESNTPHESSATAIADAGFLDFLEAQAKTQVKILEVEVRAGQELLMLHKAQHEKERVELEDEMTALRVGCSERERLCAELRANLRNCRSELACHIAHATTIKRDKSALEERLSVTETQLQAKEMELIKLRARYEEIHRVAADAQIRVEKFKRGDESEKDNQKTHESYLSVSTGVGTESKARDVVEHLPQTTQFFNSLQSRATSATAVSGLYSPSSYQPDPARPSNVAALEAMKQQMARDIQVQIASTKAALHEMEVCSASGKTLAEEEDELRQLQQQLAATSSEMAAAMDESRSKLQDLLVPTTPASATTNDAAGDMRNQELSIFDATALVNELLARAEAAPTSFATSLTQQEQSGLYKTWVTDRSRKIAQLGSYRDPQSVRQAQQSMHTFQQTLANFRSQRLTGHQQQP